MEVRRGLPQKSSCLPNFEAASNDAILERLRRSFAEEKLDDLRKASEGGLQKRILKNLRSLFFGLPIGLHVKDRYQRIKGSQIAEHASLCTSQVGGKRFDSELGDKYLQQCLELRRAEN